MYSDCSLRGKMMKDVEDASFGWFALVANPINAVLNPDA